MGGVAGHCCLQVESLRILLAVETPLREGLEEEEERRSALVLLVRDPPSVPFTHTALSTARLRSAPPWSGSSSATCSEVTQTDNPTRQNAADGTTVTIATTAPPLEPTDPFFDQAHAL